MRVDDGIVVLFQKSRHRCYDSVIISLNKVTQSSVIHVTRIHRSIFPLDDVSNTNAGQIPQQTSSRASPRVLDTF